MTRDTLHLDTPHILMSTPNPELPPTPLPEIVPDPPNRLKRVKNDGADGRNGIAREVSAAIVTVTTASLYAPAETVIVTVVPPNGLIPASARAPAGNFASPCSCLSLPTPPSHIPESNTGAAEGLTIVEISIWTNT
ncbi:hypothetical protein PILCRDRAFT_830487 [Piloderma croceum F 1598]|uniref:Uncharacterized protein n=1 Tax=Piloderma croceum (strain F 1598) TaxID=765440 RepID=A0A0C3ETU2_PILCF|nr:hypothetical protein PILCRDRAFT_830487 [Piloderma croceum F 1598]